MKEITQVTYDSIQESMRKMGEIREGIEARQVTMEVTVRDALGKIDTI